MHAPRILASLRSADSSKLPEEIADLTRAGVDGLHLDIMDGRFCEETCFGPEEVAALRPLTNLMLDAHLMVEDPAGSMDTWLATGVERISFHLEAEKNAGPLLDYIRDKGRIPGLVVLPGTPIADLEPVLDRVGLVNPLGVDPVAKEGFAESTFDRIRQLVRYRTKNNLDFLIQADGGVWEKTREGLVAAGADELVGGYPIFSTENYRKAVEKLRDG